MQTLTRVEASQDLRRFDDSLQTMNTHSCFDTSIKEHRKILMLYYVESFRRFINFDIPSLTPDDSDYNEFVHDPKVPLLKFVKTIMKHTCCPFPVLAGSIVLLKKLLSIHSNLVVSINNMHRIMTITILLSDKFLEDMSAGNNAFSNATNMKVEDINAMELEFLALLNYSPFISVSELQEVLSSWGFNIEK